MTPGSARKTDDAVGYIAELGETIAAHAANDDERLLHCSCECPCCIKRWVLVSANGGLHPVEYVLPGITFVM